MAEFFNRQWRLPNNENKNKQSNYSMYIDGGASSGRIDTNYYLPEGTKPKSISYWFKNVNPNGWAASGDYIYTVAGGQMSVGKVFGMGITSTQVHGGYIWFIGLGGGDYKIPSSATGTMTTNVWYHIVVTYDDTRTNNLHFYLDGVKIDEVNKTLNTGTTSTVKIGSNPSGGAGQGSQFIYIDAVAIYNYALSQGQITTLHGSSSTGIGNPQSITPKPVAHFPLGDQDVYNSASYLVPNASLQDYVFGFAEPHVTNYPTPNTPIIAQNKGNIFSNINNFSFSGWFNIPYYTYFFAFDIRDDNDNLYFNINMYGNQLRFNIGAGNAYIANLQNIVPTNTWFHYAGVFDGSGASDTDRLKLYIDGQPQTVVYNTTVPTSFPTIPSDANINLGKSYSVLTYTTMLSSNIQLWDSSLTPSEVQTVYNNGSPLQTFSNVPQNSNLELWWKLNASDTYDGTNWTIEDHAGSNDGTSSGMTQLALQQSDLQYTSGYSPYALDFDVATQNKINFNYRLPTGDAPKSISVWVKAKTFSYTSIVSGGTAATGQYFGLWWVNASNGFKLVTYGGDASFGFTPLVDTWYHLVVSYAGSGNVNLYYNGILGNSTNIGVRNTGNANFNIGQGGGASSFNGAVSNLSAWDTALTSTQVTEVYNSGVPSNLNNHSAYSNLESWWQLGSNSSFNNTVWTVLDEKGTNDGVSSTNMSEVDIVNGVGYTSNGVSSGMSDNVIGDAPYSTANSLSVNMDVLDRTTDTPS